MFAKNFFLEQNNLLLIYFHEHAVYFVNTLKKHLGFRITIQVLWQTEKYEQMI